MRLWAECESFLRETRRQFRTTGALFPSSRFLSGELVFELRRPTRRPSRILEVGPGTGSVTEHILRHLLPDDRLDLVEINTHFVNLLRRRFDEEWAFWYHRDQVELIHAPVEQLPGEGVYDYIISGLPLNNFPVAQVREIFRTYNRLLKPGGILSYFEYVFVRQLKSPFVNRRERRRLRAVGHVVKTYIRSYQVRRHQVLMNMPPAVVRHLRLKPASEGYNGGHHGGPVALASLPGKR